MPYKVFISYSTKDIEKLNHVRNTLQESAIEVFAAEYNLDPGESLSETIIAAIRNCDIFILLWSTNSKESEWVPQEIGIAKSSNRKILPIVLEPDIALPGFISNLKYLNAHSDPEKALEWLRSNIFKKAEEKQKNDGLFWLGLGSAILWLISK